MTFSFIAKYCYAFIITTTTLLLLNQIKTIIEALNTRNTKLNKTSKRNDVISFLWQQL